MKPAKSYSTHLWLRSKDHHHQDPPSHADEPDLTPDQQAILASFTRKVTLWFDDDDQANNWKSRYLTIFLQEADWNMDQAVLELEAYQEANYGLLATLPDHKTTLLGFENDQGTSCYLDTLLFAMYIGMTSFEPMLLGDPFEPILSVSCPTTPLSPQQQQQQQQQHHRHHRFFSRTHRRRYRHKILASLRPSSPSPDTKTLQIDTIPIETTDGIKKKPDLTLQRKHHLQRTLRLVINKLRQGQLVKRGTVAHIRQDLCQNGWYAQQGAETKQWQQEDVSELFLFLTSIFDSPYLPFQLRLFHGANTDLDDDRILTDRLLPLSLHLKDTADSMTPTIIRLESILIDHFYNSVITGVQRHIDPQHLAPVDAWQAMELLPFYSSSSSNDDYSDTPLVLPILLKRYTLDSDSGTPIKDNRSVLVPLTIPFHEFVNQNTDQAQCAQCDVAMDYVLSLKSVVCHHGSSPQSGHYTAYAITIDHYWIKFDDMDQQQRVQGDLDVEQVLADVSKYGYLFFYELNRLCQTCLLDQHKPTMEEKKVSPVEKEATTVEKVEMLDESIEKLVLDGQEIVNGQFKTNPHLEQ